MRVADIRHWLIGKPLATSQLRHQRLNKVKALAVFSSDALSSSAYATEAILLVLITAGTGALGLSWYISLGIATLLIIVAFSYYQTIHAYPNGGGAYIVAKENLGQMPGLTAAAALLIDYTLTVAVSVSAGVAALVSAFTFLSDFRVPVAIVIIAFITVINLRGVKESGTFFSIPTYAFVIGILGMVVYGTFRIITGHAVTPTAEQIEAAHEGIAVTGGLTLFIVFRAYAAGCTALTGIEAISNGIPAFKPPESRNAGQTLIVMVVLLVTMFVGITFLANHYLVVVEHHADTTVLSQISRAIFGEGIIFYYIQIATLLILSLAANTAFADFPRLASLIAADRYLPRQLTNWGDRLVYSNGIFTLAAAASILIILFRAREHNLLPLYAVGVFISFTLSQSGMVIHWLKERDLPGFKPSLSWRSHIGLNSIGAVSTFIVGIILMVTKFVEGAWIVLVTIPLLMAMFMKIHNHYVETAASLTLDGLTPGRVEVPATGRSQVPVVILMNSLNRCSLQSLEYALKVSENIHICTVEVEPQATERLRRRLKEWNLGSIPLTVLDSPYREIGEPLLKFLREFDEKTPTDTPTMVVLPEFVVSSWWERWLHNWTSETIRDALYHDQLKGGHGRAVINVPYLIGEDQYEPEMIGEISEEVINGKNGKNGKNGDAKPVTTALSKAPQSPTQADSPATPDEDESAPPPVPRDTE